MVWKKFQQLKSKPVSCREFSPLRKSGIPSRPLQRRKFLVTFFVVCIGIASCHKDVYNDNIKDEDLNSWNRFVVWSYLQMQCPAVSSHLSLMTVAPHWCVPCLQILAAQGNSAGRLSLPPTILALRAVGRPHSTSATENVYVFTNQST